MMLVGVVTITVLQFICIGVAILQDTRETPIFPRWSGSFHNIWAGICVGPGCLILFFKHGPFAWNAIFTWWLPLTVFAIWLIAMSALLLRVIAGAAHEGQGADQLESHNEPSGDQALAQVTLLTARVANLEER